MNLHTFIKKSKDYISCFVKYGAAVIVAPFAKNKEKYKDLWLIAERGIDARDNAYYLFKYITANHPEINIAYAITKDSADRERVEKLGRIINHNSFEHYISLVLSKVKISTHIMGYTPYIDFFVKADKKGIIKGKKIFLQHGIIKDNLTYLYNNNVNLDLFVCSAKPEYEYVNSLYGYKDNVVQMLGLCRYDALYKNEQPTKKVLLMPTWRYNLQGADKKEFVKSEYSQYQIFPPGRLIFNAFNLCPFDKVKVVIIGQDPYHGPGQAHGLCFSVNDGVQFPPSLVNIFKEIKADIGTDAPTTGNLTRWAEQGVLLLNATLTVRAHQAGSHQNRGWETFTDAAIRALAESKEHLVFILWGSYAQKKGAFIDRNKHLVLTSAHPSPLSAYNGFFGNKHFSRTNDYLKAHGETEINW